MNREPSGRSGVRSEINVTPLVDVCLVLLIIFMVVTPLMGNVPVELPETVAPERLSERAEKLDVSIGRAGEVRLEGKPIARERLIDGLRDMRRRMPATDVVVSADRLVRYGEVRMVLRCLHQAGFSGAGLATRMKRPHDGFSRDDTGGAR
jgi:biopolymer transport protein TolR